ISEFACISLGVEPYTEPVPVFPAAHYAMGGIPMTVKAEVLADSDSVIPGLYAAGECACVSVHGSNRLGTNSLLDINVFGKRAGIAAAEYAKTAEVVELPENPANQVVEMLEKMRTSDGTERIAAIRKDLQEIMDSNVQVFRTDETLRAALDEIAKLRERYNNVGIQDRGKRYNLDLLEAVELGFLLQLAEVISTAAIHRKES